MPTPAPWYDKAYLTGTFLSDLTREITELPFGSEWLDAPRHRADCESWVGDLDEQFPIRNWVYACTSWREGGHRTEFSYLLDESQTPTLERARYAVVPPKDASVEDWELVETALLDSLSRALQIPSWRKRDAERIGMGRDRVVIAELFVSLPDAEPKQPPRFTLLSFPVADTARSYGHYGKQGAVMERIRPVGGSTPPPEPPEPPRRTRS